MAKLIEIAPIPDITDRVMARLQKNALPQAPQLSEVQVDKPSYAWGKMPRKIIESHVDTVRKTVFGRGEDFVFLDGCSSTPWLREIMRGQYRRQCEARALEVTNSYQELVQKGAALRELSDLARSEVARRVFRPGFLPRKIIDAAVVDIIFEPHEQGVEFRTEEGLRRYFMDRFHEQPSRFYYEVVEHGEKKEDKGSWTTAVSETASVSLDEILYKLGLVDAQREDTLSHMSKFFAQNLVGTLHVAKFFSLDLESIDTLKRNAPRYFSEEVRNGPFFRNNVLNPKHHIQGDIKNLSFEDASVSFLSVVDGAWDFSYGFGMALLSEAARVLQDSGRFTSTPWATARGKPKREQELASLREYAYMIGLPTIIRSRAKVSLVEDMSEREKEIKQISTMFNIPGDAIPTLIGKRAGRSTR